MRACYPLLFLVGCAANQPAAPAPSPTPSPQPTQAAASPEPSLTGSCSRDDECAVAKFISCCQCAIDPFGAAKSWVAKLSDDCAVVECARPPHDCPPVPSVDGYRAVCERSACVLRKIGAAPR